MSAIIVVNGYVPRAPEYGHTKDGKAKVRFSLCAFGYKNDPFWINVMVFEGKLDKALAYVKAGTKLMVTGKLMKPSVRENREGVPVVDVTLFASDIGFIPTSDKSPEEHVSKEEKHSREQAGASVEDEDLPF